VPQTPDWYAGRVDLTTSYESAIPAETRARFELAEVRNASAILAATNPAAFAEIIDVLRDLRIDALDITEPGGQKSRLAIRVDETFRQLGWREGQHDMRVTSVLRLQPYRRAGERASRIVETDVLNVGYKVDNVKDRVALDVEWNAKDGNLDRDVGIYRALYESGIIDGAVMITRTFASIRDLAVRLGRPGAFGSTTTTTLDKLVPRLTRGGAGGCPVLAVAITDRCYAAP
jgi:hypothetical protein